MDIIRRKTFDNIAQRVLYGFNLVYSDFAPVYSDMATEQSQKRLHETMGQIIESLYEDPTLLGLIMIS